MLVEYCGGKILNRGRWG